MMSLNLWIMNLEYLEPKLKSAIPSHIPISSSERRYKMFETQIPLWLEYDPPEHIMHVEGLVASVFRSNLT
jgi:hypothetical protein